MAISSLPKRRRDPEERWEERTPSYAWIIGGVSALVGLTALGLSRFAYALLLPLMRDSFGLHATGAGLLSSANLCGFLAGALVGGTVATRAGTRAVISGGLLLGAVGAGLTAFGQGATSVAGWQFVVGCGAGAAMMPAQNLPMLWFPAAKRGFASGLPTAGVGVGVVLVGLGFPWLLGVEVHGLTGWRLAWLGIGGMLLTTALCAGLWLRESPPAQGRSENAREVIRTWRIWHLCLVYLLFGLSSLSYVAFFGLVLSNHRHWLPGASGRAWALGGLLSIASGLLWGALSDRIGRRQAIGLVFSVQALSYLILAVWDWDGAVYLSVGLWGVTAWATPALVAALATDYVGVRLVHPVMGLVNVVGAIGQIGGPIVAGYAIDRSGSFAAAPLIAASGALLGALSAFTLPEQGRSGREEPSALLGQR
jgi:predicted MFS family arabinose efflux permease